MSYEAKLCLIMKDLGELRASQDEIMARIDTLSAVLAERMGDQDERLDSVKEAVDSVAAHVPFVDSLANSGVVRAVKTMNGMLHAVSPAALLMTSLSIEDESLD